MTVKHTITCEYAVLQVSRNDTVHDPIKYWKGFNSSGFIIFVVINSVWVVYQWVAHTHDFQAKHGKHICLNIVWWWINPRPCYFISITGRVTWIHALRRLFLASMFVQNIEWAYNRREWRGSWRPPSQRRQHCILYINVLRTLHYHYADGNGDITLSKELKDDIISVNRVPSLPPALPTSSLGPLPRSLAPSLPRSLAPSLPPSRSSGSLQPSLTASYTF